MHGRAGEKPATARVRQRETMRSRMERVALSTRRWGLWQRGAQLSGRKLTEESGLRKGEFPNQLVQKGVINAVIPDITFDMQDPRTTHFRG